MPADLARPVALVALCQALLPMGFLQSTQELLHQLLCENGAGEPLRQLMYHTGSMSAFWKGKDLIGGQPLRCALSKACPTFMLPAL